jgi:hypothetical protein
MEEHAKVTSGERFWAAGPACVLTGYEIANRLGLTNVNIERLVRFSVKAINNMRGVVSENTKSPNNAIADYLNSNLRNMLVLNSQPLDGKLAMVAQEPRDAVRIRYEVWNNQAYVDRSHLREWCSARSVDWSNLKQTLKRQGILTGEVRMVLGKSFFLGETDDDSLVYNDGFGQLTFSADGSTQFPIVGGPFQAGIYRSVSFNVLQAPDSEDSVIDDDFTQGNQRFSIIIDGTYNEEPFNFRSKQEFMNSFNFNPDLTVSQNNQRFVYTFVNNAQQWFRQANTLLDPRVEENRSKINERIGLGFDLDENTSEQQ